MFIKERLGPYFFIAHHSSLNRELLPAGFYLRLRTEHSHRCCLALPVRVPDQVEILGVQLGNFGELSMGDLLDRHPALSHVSEARLDIKLGFVRLDVLRAGRRGAVEVAHRDTSLPKPSLQQALIFWISSGPVLGLGHIHLLVLVPWALHALG